MDDRYFGDLLRLRNMLAAPANPAATMANQGVSLATAASKMRVNSLLGGGVFLRSGRDNDTVTAQIDEGAASAA